MRGRTLVVLMWKHLMVRKRAYYCQTAVEFISTILFVLILFCLRNILKPPMPKAKPLWENNDDNMVKMTEVKLLDGAHSVSSPRFILYTPNKKLPNMLMDEVGLKLGLTRQTSLPNKKRDGDYKGYYAFSNVSEIADFASSIRANEAIIIFKDSEMFESRSRTEGVFDLINSCAKCMCSHTVKENIVKKSDLEGEFWPDKLEYTIRMQYRFNTHSFMSHDDDAAGDHHVFGDDYEEFMLLQWTIDTSFIKVSTGNTVPQTLSLQEFPYYNSPRSAGVRLICSILPFICWFSTIIFFMFLISRLIEERASGIQELIKMMGVSSNTLGLSHFLNVVPTGLMYAVFTTVFLTVGDNPIIEHSNGLIIFITMALHFVSLTAMVFASSYLAKTTQYTTTVAMCVNIGLWLPSDLLSNFPPSQAIIPLSGIFPHVPVTWLFKELAELEQYNMGLTFADISKSHTSETGSVLLGFGWLVVHSVIFFILAWYLSYVRPGQYGHAWPWNFLCKKQYWMQSDIKPVSDINEKELVARDKKYFEDLPKDMNVGIRIENISKRFGKHKVLSNVTLEVFKGEITILLGHNGAGKTTLMSIITGMMSPTEGIIYVNGKDTVKQRDKIKNQLGLCPQHNMFFPDLTVLEHAMFFTLLKGGSYKLVRESSMVLLQRLGIAGKAHSYSGELSGGMKRRLQLACALSGGASVLVLDEPTSGLDVQTRRDLWDLLLSLRGDRTVLLTTHFMEEADALGDRVAALQKGQLRCHATTMYLKRAIGTGYRLSLITNGVPHDPPITSVVTSFVPDASIKEKTLTSLSYNLPATGSAQFPKMFTALEEKKSELGIATLGVGISSLEEVFLQLCSDTDTSFSEDDHDTGRIEPTYNKVTGLPLYLRQFRLLFKRQYKYMKTKIFDFLILQSILPILIIFGLTYMCNNSKETAKLNTLSQPDITLNLDLYTPMPERKVLYNVDAPGASLRAFDEDDKKVVFTTAENISNAILRTGKQSILEYNKHLVGIELTDTEAKALYTTVYRHAAPVAVNLLTNMIASQYLPAASGRAITTHNHPIDGGVMSYADTLINAKTVQLCIIWTAFIVFIILSTNISFVSLPCRERVSGSRHLHVMAGCPAALHWLTTLSFHILVCLMIMVVSTTIAAAAVDKDSTLTQPDMILTLMLILTLGSLAFFAFMYLLSFFFTEEGTAAILYAVIIGLGLVTSAVKTAIGLFSEKGNIFLRIFLALVSYTMPPHTMTVAAAKCVLVARLNALCNLIRGSCPDLLVNAVEFDTEKCCAGKNPQNYLEISKAAPGPEMISLIAQFIVYMTLVVLSQKGTFKCMCDRIFNKKIITLASVQPGDEFVRAEAVYVSKEITLPTKQIEDAKVAMLVNDVHKNYHKIIGKSCYAVQGLSLSVKKGECFGLLGVNGAGKSTTFKMMTTEECATKGEIYANGHHINKNKGAYLRSLGYCPQFFGLDDFQTGRDNLALLLTLRGLDSADVSAQVTSWIDVVGLQKYSSSLVSDYSGGCTRRLGAAAALASGTPLTLLDEPTAGVDVAARRRVWSALRRALRLQRSIVITSHSMDEMEALCARIGIMSGGRLRALGTPAELRARHATGHAVVIKLKHGEDAVEGSKRISEIDSLKNNLQTIFNCTLKDEHKTMLHYHINETMRYSNLFTEMEKLKSTYPFLLEDYSVTETTLEEVFLSLAKEAQQKPANTKAVV